MLGFWAKLSFEGFEFEVLVMKKSKKEKKKEILILSNTYF